MNEAMDDLFEGLDVIEEQEVKNEKTKKETAPKQKEKKSDTRKIRFPFGMYVDSELLDISHIFEEDKEYTEEEITKLMAQHKFYNFAGNVTYDLHEEDNVLIPIFKQHAKG